MSVDYKIEPLLFFNDFSRMNVYGFNVFIYLCKQIENYQEHGQRLIFYKIARGKADNGT